MQGSMPHLRCTLALLLALTAAAAASAQQATERYIPLGQSAGISGKTAIIGTVESFRDGVLTLVLPGQPTPQRVRVLPSTKIWLDHAASQRSNTTGEPADLVSGRRVEVHFADPGTRQNAAWVKVQTAVER